jgi:hypothetical protein
MLSRLGSWETENKQQSTVKYKTAQTIKEGEVVSCEPATVYMRFWCIPLCQRGFTVFLPHVFFWLAG